MLCKQALIFNSKIGGTTDFKASSGWLKHFKSRHGIRGLNIEGEISSCHFLLVEKFKEIFLNTVKRERYTRNDIYNADKTGVNWKALSRKLLASRCESSAPSYKFGKDMDYCNGFRKC